MRRASKEINAVAEEMLTDNRALTLVKKIKIKMLRRLSEGNWIYKRKGEGSWRRWNDRESEKVQQSQHNIGVISGVVFFPHNIFIDNKYAIQYNTGQSSMKKQKCK